MPNIKREVKMRDIIITVLMLLSPFLICLSCVKGSTNPTIDSSIHVVDEVYPDDNIFEEGFEEWVEDKTTLDVDFTPATPEK